MNKLMIKKILIAAYICLIIIYMYSITGVSIANDKIFASPDSKDVHIGPNAISMPLGNILLMRRDSEYCAIKFIKFWAENNSEVGTIFVSSGSDEYAIYESYYQGDKSGAFSKKNVQFKKEKLSSPKPRGIGRLAFSFGNRNIICGDIKLQWSGKGSIYFYKEGQKQGDYGIELAPTIWTDISQVYVLDSRIKWYKYDEKRKRQDIPIDELWLGKKNEK